MVSLVSPSPKGPKTIYTFHPKHTYSIFGDSEEIFGYKDLEINLRYNASDMRPNLSFSYSKKFPTVGETEATDVEGALREFLPDVAFQKENDFDTAIKNVPVDWTPPGEVITKFTTRGTDYEVWKANLADPAVKQLVKRIQILVPFYIEGGTLIDVDGSDADRWTVFFLYEKKSAGDDGTNPYVFVGYCTVYRFFVLLPNKTVPTASPSEEVVEKAAEGQDFDLSQLPCRTRISQFVIIPPFQGRGLGPKLYRAIFDEYIAHPQTVEITVEDPNEAFDDMRDVADLHYLRSLPEFRALRLNTDLVIPKTGPSPDNIVDKQACEAVRAKAKMAPRQFARVLEMDLMSRLPETVRPGIAPPEEVEGKTKGKGKAPARPRPTPEQEHEYKLWKLLLKVRLYKHNKDALGELELSERKAKLDETVASVEFDYARLLVRAEEQLRLAEKDATAPASEPNVSAVKNGKRKAENGNGVEDGIQAPVSKKARVEDASDDE
jgi:histone acetyltransferase 1